MNGLHFTHSDAAVHYWRDAAERYTALWETCKRRCLPTEAAIALAAARIAEREPPIAIVRNLALWPI